MGHTNFEQIKLLLWKNSVLQKRKIWTTFFEIVIPLSFSLVLIFIRSLVNREFIHEPKIWKNFSVTDFPNRLFPELHSYSQNSRSWKLHYAPSNEITDNIMRRTSQILGKTHFFPNVFSHPNETEMVDDIMLCLDGDQVSCNILGGVVFDSDLSLNTSVTTDFKYKIRLATGGRYNKTTFHKWSPNDNSQWFTDRMFPVFEMTAPRQSELLHGGIPGIFFLANHLFTL